MTNKVYKLKIADFEKIFDDDFSNLNNTTKHISNYDFSYSLPSFSHRDNLLLEVVKKIENDKQIIGDEGRKDVWFKGWQENYEEYKKTNNLDAIRPKFIRDKMPLRFNQEYIIPEVNDFEKNFNIVIQSYIYERYLRSFKNIYEFGCGSGFNLSSMVNMDISKSTRFFGTDFVQSSVDTINLIAKNTKANLSAKLFNMINPDYDYDFNQDSALFTFGAIEQLASKHGEFVDFLLQKKPNICLHVEPTIELYEEDNLVDYLAIQFHKKRGYTQGFLTDLLELEKEKKIKIDKVHRLRFGSFFLEGYSLIVWRVI